VIIHCDRRTTLIICMCHPWKAEKEMTAPWTWRTHSYFLLLTLSSKMRDERWEGRDAFSEECRLRMRAELLRALAMGCGFSFVLWRHKN